MIPPKTQDSVHLHVSHKDHCPRPFLHKEEQVDGSRQREDYQCVSRLILKCRRDREPVHYIIIVPSFEVMPINVRGRYEFSFLMY